MTLCQWGGLLAPRRSAPTAPAQFLLHPLPPSAGLQAACLSALQASKQVLRGPTGTWVPWAEGCQCVTV